MSDFQTVLIERHGRHYRLHQHGDLSLAVPEAIFDSFEADAVFPPQWTSKRERHPIRRLYWNPDTREFLMAGLEAHPVRVVEINALTPYRSFVRAVWLPQPPTLFLHPYWHPETPYDPFDQPARHKSLEMQRRFLDLLDGLRPPPGWIGVLNATDAYLSTMGLDAEPSPGRHIHSTGVEEISLTPGLPSHSGLAAEALTLLGTEAVGEVLPVLRGPDLAGFHCMGLREQHRAEAELQRLGINYQLGPYRPH